MPQQLFRSEVLEARRDSWLGRISLAQPLPFRVLTAFTVTATLTVGLFLAFATYTRRSTVSGRLVPSKGLAIVVSPAAGVITQLEVVEGDRLRVGQRLAVVEVPRATPIGGDTQIALATQIDRRREGLVSLQAAQQAQLQAQADGLRRQLMTAREELVQTQAEVATRRQQARIAGETLARLKQLEDNRYVSLLQIKQQESVSLDTAGQVQSLERQVIVARRGIAQLEQTLRELPGQREEMRALLHRDLAQLETDRVQTLAQGALALSAPVSGIVATQVVKQGQSVQAGQTLMSLLPGDGTLEAELLVPSRAMGFIELGDKVLLRYQAYPYQKFGHQLGRVTQISRSVLGPGELGGLAGNQQQSEPYYRVTVELARQAVTAYAKAEQLRPGMLLEADVLGERRRLIEWVFEPLYSLKGKVGGA